MLNWEEHLKISLFIKTIVLVVFKFVHIQVRLENIFSLHHKDTPEFCNLTSFTMY